MKYADLIKYSPGTELFWNGHVDWHRQFHGSTKRVFMPTGRVMKDGGKVLLHSDERVYDREKKAYVKQREMHWYTLAGIRGPWAPCWARKEEHKRWSEQARVRQGVEYKRRGTLQAEVVRGFAEHGIVVRESWDSLRLSFIEVSEHDAILLLSLLNELE